MRRREALNRSLGCLGLVLLGGPAAADEVEEPPVVDVEVAGTRPVAARDHVRTRDLFEAGTHRTGSDLLRTVPGVFVTQHSGEGKAHQIFFRGFDAVHGQDVEVSVGGVPVNEISHIHGQGYADLHFVIPEVVERVVALPGALDARQGDFAVAGSLRYELGYPESGLTTKLGAGSFGARRALILYHPKDAPPQNFAAAELYQSDGFGQARSADRANLMLQWTKPLGRDVELRLLGSSYAARFDSAGVVRERDVERGLVGRFDSYDPEQGGHSQRSQFALALRRTTPSWRLEATPYAILRALSLRSNYTGALQHADTGDRTSQENDSITLGFTSRSEHALPLISDSDTVALGLSARRDGIDQSQRTTSLPPTVDTQVTALAVGAYADLRLRPLRRVALHTAVRADFLAFDVLDKSAGVTRTSAGQHLGPKVTLDVLVLPGVIAFAGYGQGFRSPQARSLGDGERTPFTRVQSGELGLRYHDADRFSVQAATFGSALDDDLVFDETTSRNEPTPSTRRVGAALDLVARGPQGFIAGCGSSYSRATFTASDDRYSNGETVPHVPAWVLRCDLGARPHLFDLDGGALAAHLGTSFGALLDRPLPYGERGSDVLLVDALAGLGYRDVELELSVQNLFDRVWNDGEFVYASAFPDVPASAVPQRHVTAGAPRTVFVTATVRLR